MEEVQAVVYGFQPPGVFGDVPSSLDVGGFLLFGHVWSWHGLRFVSL